MSYSAIGQDNCIMKTVRVSPFISKLFEILSDASNRHIISWDQHGIGFEIYSLTEFENKIIKNHFKHKTITSFFRQLNLYDFQRTSDGRKTRGKPGMNQCTFRHRFFTPCSPQNLCHVRRQNKKKPVKRPMLTFVPPESPAMPEQSQETPYMMQTTPAYMPPYDLTSSVDYTNYYEMPMYPPYVPGMEWQQTPFFTPTHLNSPTYPRYFRNHSG